MSRLRSIQAPPLGLEFSKKGFDSLMLWLSELTDSVRVLVEDAGHDHSYTDILSVPDHDHTGKYKKQ